MPPDLDDCMTRDDRADSIEPLHYSYTGQAPFNPVRYRISVGRLSHIFGTERQSRQ
jgi:hypothetical protein